MTLQKKLKIWTTTGVLLVLGVLIAKDWKPLPEEPMGASISAPSSVGGSMVGYWTLNESDDNGTSQKDKSGNGNDGAIAVTPATYVADQNGVPNQAMEFDGVGDYLNLGKNFFEGYSALTVGAWIKTDTAPASNANLIGQEDALYFQLQSDGTVLAGIHAVGANILTGDLTDNNWHFVVYTFDGVAGDRNLYVDGVLVDSSLSGTTGVVSYSDYYTYIGRRVNYYDGYMSDVVAYSSALTADQVSRLYKAGRTTAKVKVDASDLVVNGGFDSDTDWTKGTGWTISGGIANCDGTQSSATEIYQDIDIITGRTYKVKYTISNYSAGTIRAIVGGTGSGSLRSANGTYVQNIVCSGTPTNRFYFQGNSDFIGSIDNVEVVDITNAITPKLQKGLILDMPLSEPYTEAGSDLLSGWDFTSGWTTNSATIDDSDSFTSSNNGGLISNIGTTGIVAGRTYKINFQGSTSASGILVFNANSAANTILSDFGSTTFTALNEYLYIRNTDTGTTDITTLIIKELDGTTKDTTPYGNDGNVSGATIKYDGLVNTDAGVAYINQDKAYGSWEFDVNKDADGNYLRNHFISDASDFSGGSYQFVFTSSEDIQLRRYDSGASVEILINSGSGYADINTNYRIKITRDLSGTFTMYIKGGSFGWDDWTTIGTATDNTYTTSNYFVVDIDSGDTVSNLKIDGKRISLADATQSSGTWTTTAPSYDFDGTDDYIDLSSADGLIGKTYNFWLKPEWTTTYFFDIDGTNYFMVDNNVITTVGLSSTKYVNSISTSTVTPNEWNMVTVILSSDSEDLSSANIGKFGGNYFNGQISGLKIYNRVLSTDEIEYLYNKEVNKY